MTFIFCLFIISQPVFPQSAKYVMELGGGEVGSFLGWAIGFNTATFLGCNDEESSIIALSSGLVLSSITTYLIGERFDEGNYIPTFIGGLAAGLLSSLVFQEKDYRYYAIALSFPIGEFIGYNLFKKKPRVGKSD